MQNNPYRTRKPTLPSSDYELNFQPEFFAVKGKVLDGDGEEYHQQQKSRTRAPPSETNFSIVHTPPLKKSNSKNPFRFPQIENEDIFETNLQESSTNHKKFRHSTHSPELLSFRYDEGKDDFSVKSKTKPTSSFLRFDEDESHGPSSYKTYKPQYVSKKPPPNFFKNDRQPSQIEDEYDFSIKHFPTKTVPRSTSTPTGPIITKGIKFGKFETDFDVKDIGFPQSSSSSQDARKFKPNFKLRDIPHLYSDDTSGVGIAAPGQIKNYYDAVDSEIDGKIRQKLKNDPNPASRGQYQQYLKTKEDERLEKIIEQQFAQHMQQQIEKELRAHKQAQRTKKQSKQNRSQPTRQKRRPSRPSRRQRSSGSSPSPVRAISNKDGSYTVTFSG